MSDPAIIVVPDDEWNGDKPFDHADEVVPEKPTPEAAYELVKGVIHKCVFDHLKRFAYLNLEFDEVYQDASMAFMKAYHSYIPVNRVAKTGNWHLGGWVQFKVSKYLMSQARNEFRDRGRRDRYEDADLDALSAGGKTELLPVEFDWQETDAGWVADCVVRGLDGVKPGKAQRKALIKLLLELGWSGKRILNAFMTVEEENRIGSATRCPEVRWVTVGGKT